MSFVSCTTQTVYPVINHPQYDTWVFPDILCTMNIQKVLKKLKILGVSDITDDEEMTLFSATDFFTFDDIDPNTLLVALSRVTKKSMDSLLSSLFKMNRNINHRFFINDCLECDKGKGPYILNKNKTYIDTIFTLPPIINEWNTTKDESIVEILADIINHMLFAGIGGFVNVSGEKSVYFMKNVNHYVNDDRDYRKHVSFEIDEDELKHYFYHPLTVGEYFEERFGKIHKEEDTFKIDDLDRVYKTHLFRHANEMAKKFISAEYSSIYESHYNFSFGEGSGEDFERIRNERKNLRKLEEEMFGSNELLPLLESKIGNGNDTYPGFFYFAGVPIDLQILACAKVAHLTRDQMYARLDAAQEEFIQE